jgi:predicted HTH transcriptional regulator
MSIRLPRIEALISQQLESATESDLAKLTAGGVPEDADLDYKQQIYGSSDSDKRDLAGDVAALANTLGGLLLIGVQENETGNAAQLSPVLITGQENVRIRQIVATYVAPIPQFEIFHVPSANTPPNSYLLLVVAPSPYRPHAVRVNESLRYPVRDGP